MTSEAFFVCAEFVDFVFPVEKDDSLNIKVHLMVY